MDIYYKGIKYIFLDYFDTIVHRTVSPEYIKKIWCKQVIIQSGIKLNTECLYNLREECAKKISNNNKKRGLDSEYNYDSLIREIYNILTLNNLLCEERFEYINFYELCLFIEIEIEKSHQVINKDIIDIINKYKISNCKIYCISDFYLPKVAFDEFFKHHNLVEKFESVYVSSEYLLQKHSGSLYELVIKDLNIVDLKEVLMIGDNYNSDFIKPKEIGLNSMHIDRTDFHKKYSEMWNQANNRKNMIKKIDNIYNNTRKNMSPFSSYSLYYYLFAEKLYRQLIRDNIKNVFFLSREGEMLKKIFDKYQDMQGEHFQKINTHYLLVSRAATFLAKLKDIEDEKFERLFNQYDFMSIYNFLHSIAFSESEIEAVQNDINIDIHTMIKNFSKSDEFDYLKKSNVFINLYNTKRYNQKYGLKKYINSFGVDIYSECINIVDVGWKGSMQDNINELFEGIINIRGYYLGLNEISNISKQNLKHGIIFSILPTKSNYYDELSIKYWEHEYLLYPSHGRASTYNILDCGNIDVVCENEPKVVEVYEKVAKNIQQDMLNVMEDIQKIFNGHWLAEDFISYIAYLHKKTFFTKTHKEYSVEQILDKNHYSSFGIDNLNISNENYTKIRINLKIKLFIKRMINFIKNPKPNLKLGRKLNSIILAFGKKNYI